uniref:Uncharacterized protein n=1 Tax=Lactuca sativa TaxID=4236 RepID=A0A9R1WCL0_LACSA|nr:hypothetical protein LSAT_V11C200092850 [Lactuca sativa]
MILPMQHLTGSLTGFSEQLVNSATSILILANISALLLDSTSIPWLIFQLLRFTPFVSKLLQRCSKPSFQQTRPSGPTCCFEVHNLFWEFLGLYVPVPCMYLCLEYHP